MTVVFRQSLVSLSCCVSDMVTKFITNPTGSTGWPSLFTSIFTVVMATVSVTMNTSATKLCS